MDGYAVTKELCEKEHKSVNEQLRRHDKWLAEHEIKIDTLTRSDATNTTEIKNLCKQIGDLVTTIKWLIGILITSLAGFFFYAVQAGIFKN